MSSSVGMAALFASYPCSSCTTIATTASSSGRSSRRLTSIVTTCLSSRFCPRLPRSTRASKEITRWQKQQQLRCGLEADNIAPAAGDIQHSSTEAAALPQAEKYEVSYRHERKISNNADGGGGGGEVETEMEDGKGWTDLEGKLDARWVAKFRALIVVVADRVEIHSVLAKQRNNWSHLFHHTIVVASVSAATVAAINGAEPGPGLMLMATALNLICAAFMALVNSQQPSQLAEEQVRAARFFKRLMKDVESTLAIGPDMREEASVYWEDKLGTLYALDKSFPLPLTPGGLEKFPRRVRPPELSRPENLDEHEAQHKSLGLPDPRHRYGWTLKTEEYLRQTIERIHYGDVPTQIRFAETAKLLNLIMARASPMLAIAGAFCSFASAVPALSLFHVSWLAAALTVGAVFAHSASHALQIGSGFEMYRNCAGYYEELRKAVERALKLPENEREDPELFRERFNMELGHHPLRETLKTDYPTVGRLF